MSFFCGMERTEYSGFFLIAADHSRMHLIQKLPEFSPAKRTSAHTDRIENNRMAKLIGTFPGKDACPDLGFIGHRC